MIKSLFALAIITAIAPLGCDRYTGFRLDLTTTPPGNVVVSSTNIEIPQGVVVGVRATAQGGSDPAEGELSIELRSLDPDKLQVWPTTEENTFVFCGGSEGVARITVYVDGQSDQTVTALVGPPIEGLVP